MFPTLIASCTTHRFRAHRLPWFPDVDAQINTLIMLADIGIQKGMANSTTEFVVVCDSKSAPP